MLRSGLITILTIVKRMWQEMWSKIARGHQWREYRWGCVTRLYLHHCPHHMQQVEGGVSTRVTARGRGTTAHIVPLGQGGQGAGGHPLAGRGGSSTNRFLSWHTYNCQLTAGDRGAVSGGARLRGCRVSNVVARGGRVGPELGQPRYCHRGWAVSRVTCHKSLSSRN